MSQSHANHVAERSQSLTTSNLVQKSYLINLARRPDRLSQLQSELDKGWPLPQPIIYPAIDGNKVGVPDSYQSGGGAYGCLRSHQRILEDCLMQDVSSVLVLEDDMAIYEDFAEHLATFLKYLPDDWDGIMLGGQHIRKATPVNDFCDRCVNCQRTHAYVVRGRYMRELYRMWCDSSSTVHCDWTMGPFQAKFKVYAPKPFLIGQRGGKSDISGNDDPKKFWATARHDAPVVVVRNATPETMAALRLRGLHHGYRRTGDICHGLTKIVTARSRTSELRKWLDMIQGECASDRGLIACVNHPEITLEEVRAVAGGRVIEVDGSSLEAALDALAGMLTMDRIADQAVTLLRAERPVFEGLLAAGWHGGHWRAATGHDNGLLDIVRKKEWERLRPWADRLFEEKPGGIIVAWHTKLDKDILAQYSKRKVVEVIASSVQEALMKQKDLVTDVAMD